jgi:hypothetical protein
MSRVHIVQIYNTCGWIYIICGFDFINVIKIHDGFQVLGCVSIVMDLDKMTIVLQTCLYL